MTALDPEKGTLWHHADFTIAAAILAELAREDRIGATGSGKKARVTLHDATPLGDDVLDDALATIGSAVFGDKVTTLAGFLPDSLQVLRQLAAAGAVTEREHRVLGLVPTRRYLPTPVADRDRLVAAVRSALLGESVPDDRTALLVAALSVAIPFRRFVPRARVDEAEQRAGEILRSLPEDERVLLDAVSTALSIKTSREA